MNQDKYLGSGNRVNCITRSCNTSRRPPALPSYFEAEIVHKDFTDGTDPDLVVKKYVEIFNKAMLDIQRLFFDGLFWGDADAEAVAAILPSCTRLSFLRLDENRIGNPGAAALTAGLLCRSGSEDPKGVRSRSSGLELSLNSNQIGDQGAAALAQALRCRKVAKLVLSGNPVGANGKNALLDAGDQYLSMSWVVRGAS